MAPQYDVFGMGAALVDTEIEVSDNDLKALAIDKGLMTLVDEQRQNELLHHLRDHLTASSRASGGSAANTIIAVSAFGGRSFFCGKVADDENGEFYLNDLRQAGVGARPLDGLPQGTTGKCLVMITPDAERTMNTFLGISETLAADDLELDALAASRYLYIEGYLATSDTGRPAAVAARKHAQKSGVKVAVSLSDPGIVRHCRPQLEEILGRRVDLLFCNQEEALAWTGCEHLNDATELLADWTECFAVTLGADGALVHDGTEMHQIPGRQVTAVDTNGAGDMFAGAFLYGINHGMSHARAGEFACMAAAAVVAQFGPRLPLRQYAGLRESFNGGR